MQNPYETLGIREGASKDEIKAAYRELVKKYHPDKHQNNPLNELAQEKMQEVNEAYDFLMNDANAGNDYGSSGYGGASRPSGTSSSYRSALTPEYAEIRRAIDRGNLAEAEGRLGRIGMKDAEWHYLSGIIMLRKGWYDQAVSNIQTAVSMEPGNMEYRNAMSRIMNSTRNYSQGGYQRGYQDAESQLCQCMQCYCCADACCDCI